MTHEEAIALLQDIVLNGRRHKHYNRTVALAKEYKAFITGEGIEKYIPRFERREDTKAYEQRVEITVDISETVCSNIIDPQHKLPRSNSIEKELTFIDNDTKKEDTLVDILEHFWDGKYSLEGFMGKPWVELNNLDPNTFVVIDWKFNKDGKRIRPYPVEYYSENVIDYNKVHGDLKWICVYRPPEEVDPETYILYTPDFTVMFRKKEEPNHSYEDMTFFQKFPIKDFESRVAAIRDSDATYYDVYVFKPHNLGRVPGFFVGFHTDMRNRQTFVSPIHKAMPILKKIVKSNSELDLILSLHTFPQKVQYVNPCPECNGNGRMPTGLLCDKCEGQGIDKRDIHKSSQDVMYIPRPKDKEEQMDLSKMVHYVEYSVELFEAVDRYVDKLIRRCKEAVYNSEVFSRGEVPETAYQRNIELQNVYDALWPMAKAYEQVYNFVVDTVAKVTKLDDKLVHNLSFRKDFKMKGLSDLYEDLSKVATANPDEFVKRGIEDDIAEILYEDQPRELLKYRTMKYFFPFSGKDKNEIKQIVTMPNLTTMEVKTLWANFAYIFDELEMEYKKQKVDFYRMPREEQKDAVDKKVAQLVEKAAEQESIDLNLGREADEPEA